MIIKTVATVIMKESENCTNEANLEGESGESHPHPEKRVQDEDAAKVGVQTELQNS